MAIYVPQARCWPTNLATAKQCMLGLARTRTTHLRVDVVLRMCRKPVGQSFRRNKSRRSMVADNFQGHPRQRAQTNILPGTRLAKCSCMDGPRVSSFRNRPRCSRRRDPRLAERFARTSWSSTTRGDTSSTTTATTGTTTDNTSTTDNRCHRCHQHHRT